MPTLDSLFDRFLRERTYLKNVSPKTRIWYQTAWKTFLARKGRASAPRPSTRPGDHTPAPAGVRGRAPRPWCPSRDGEHVAVRVERLLPLAARRRRRPPRAGQTPAVESREAARQDAGRGRSAASSLPLLRQSASCDGNTARDVGFAARKEPGDVRVGPEKLPVDATGGGLAVLVDLVEAGCAPDLARARTLPRLPASWLYRGGDPSRPT